MKMAIFKGRHSFGEGDTIFTAFGTKEVAETEHTIVEEVPKKVIEAAGFESREDLFERMQIIYPETEWVSPVTVVRLGDG